MPPEQVTVEQQEEWLEEPPESELPPRPRRRLLRVGGNPIQLALMGVLAIACGFIGGVLVEKGQNSSSSSGGGASGLASRFAALRAGASGASGASGTGARSGSGAGSASSGFFGGSAAGAAGGFKRPTAGTVAYLDGNTLYVTNAEGNTVKVTTSVGTTVNKTVKSSVKAIHPGETVTITGETGSGGSLSAESINVGSDGGLAALLGGSGARGGSGSSSRSGGAGEPALFGG